MPALQESAALQKAAQAHADYLVRHRLSAHSERASEKGFTGTGPMDRALRAGYAARFVGENLSTRSHNALDSVHGLFSAIYHRFGFLNPAFDEVGIGIAQERAKPRNTAFVYLMGNSEIGQLCRAKTFEGVGRYVRGICADTRHRIEARAYDRARRMTRERSPKILIYPYDGQEDVPPAFYQESPDPLPDYDVSGFPVSVEFNSRYFHKVKVLSFRLYESGGGEVKHLRLLNKASDPNHELTRRQFALLPLERLKYGEEYRVELIYRHRKQSHKLVWSFVTRKPSEALKIITRSETTLTLKRGQGYWLYFKPKNPHDVLGTMTFPRQLYLRFVDPNTMRIVLDPDSSDDFDIRGSGRRVHIRVK